MDCKFQNKLEKSLQASSKVIWLNYKDIKDKSK